jgi:hypothetical protein
MNPDSDPLTDDGNAGRAYRRAADARWHVARWHDTARDPEDRRQSLNDAVDAIDDLVRSAYLLRESLVTQARAASDALLGDSA